MVQDGANINVSPNIFSKGKDAAGVDSARQVVNPSTSHPSAALEDVDLSDLDETTLDADFQVGRHVGFSSLFSIILSVHDQRSRWE